MDNADDTLSELRKKILESKKVRKRGFEGPGDGSTGREEGEWKNLMVRRSQRLTPSRFHPRQFIPTSGTKYGYAANYRPPDPVLTYIPFAPHGQNFTLGCPTLPNPTPFNPPVRFPEYHGYGIPNGVVGPPIPTVPYPPPVSRSAHITSRYPPPVSRSAHVASQPPHPSKPRPVSREADRSETELAFNCVVPAGCQFTDAPISELISKFKGGQLPPHGQIVASVKILQALGERGATLEALAAEAITQDQLRMLGVVPAPRPGGPNQPGFITDAPTTAIDKHFVTHRVNALLLSDGEPASRGHDFPDPRAAHQKTHGQLSRCQAGTLVELVSFNGYLQAPDAVVELSAMLKLLNYPKASTTVDEPEGGMSPRHCQIPTGCPMEQQASCPNLGCSFTHRCDNDRALGGDLNVVRDQLFLLYPNPASSLRAQFEVLLETLHAQNADPSEALRRIRRAYREDWACELSAGARGASEADPLSSPVAPREETPEVGAFYFAKPCIFKDLGEFLQFRELGSEGSFARHLKAAPHTGGDFVTREFQALVAEVRETGSATKTLAALGNSLSEGCHVAILWRLYYALVLFYRVAPSRLLIELAFQKHPRDCLLHLLIYLAYPALADKALVLQLSLQAGANLDPRSTSSIVLWALVNLLALLDATRTGPAVVVGRYAALLIDPHPPTGLRRMLAADPVDFPAKLPLAPAFASHQLKGDDFVFCWLVFIYYLGFHGLPPVFASAPFHSCIRPALFLIRWELAPKACVDENRVPLLLVFGELIRQWYILQSHGCNGLIALLRNYVAFASRFAPAKLPDIEAVLVNIRDECPSLAEVHELLFQVMQKQSKLVPDTFWPAAFERASSPGLANFYIACNCSKGDLRPALELALRHQAPASQCYFSWILQSKLALEAAGPQTIRQEVGRLFKDALIAHPNPRIRELLRLDYLRCVHEVNAESGFIDALGLLDDVLCEAPGAYIPDPFGAMEGIETATDFAFAERSVGMVASWTDYTPAHRDMFSMAGVSFPGSFRFAQRVCELTKGDVLELANKFLASAPTDEGGWEVVLKHALDGSSTSAQLITTRRAYLSLSPRLFSLSLPLGN
ncbi:hypothetical protein L0F63_003555 [Massospora cicadina]|nr:hypothetical protein L0F63_003555 [Massospora cicadina]